MPYAGYDELVANLLQAITTQEQTNNMRDSFADRKQDRKDKEAKRHALYGAGIQATPGILSSIVGAAGGGSGGG